MGELGERKKKILKAIVDDYITNAEPVGSKTLQGKLEFKVSSATLRNEMADLEAMGYLEQPHTSAGRIPTPRGYRLYVDELMAHHRLSLQEMEQINREMQEKMQKMDHIVSEAGKLVSRMTHYTTYAMARKTEKSGYVLHFDLLLHEKYRVILVLVTDRHDVKSKMLPSETAVSEEDLRNLASALNQNLAGVRCDAITSEQVAKTAYDAGEPGARLLPSVLNFLAELIRCDEDGEVYLTGASNILTHPEYRDIIRARELLEYLSDRDAMARLPMPSTPGNMQIMIGPENVADQLRDASVVMASYQLGGGMRGLIGVVGPTRMDYSKVASRLSYFAKKLGEMFAEEAEESEEQLEDQDDGKKATGRD